LPSPSWLICTRHKRERCIRRALKKAAG
jgi:hypothetical protein